MGSVRHLQPVCPQLPAAVASYEYRTEILFSHSSIASRVVRASDKFLALGR